MAVIDIHTHIYPSRISDKATKATGSFYNLEMFGEDLAKGEVSGTTAAANSAPERRFSDMAYEQPIRKIPADIEKYAAGTAEQLFAATAGGPITHHVVHSVATSISQVEHINNFILEECKAHPEFIGFGCMYQDYGDPVAELRRIKAAGLKGIKIHPDIQKVNLDDPRLMKTYEACEALDLPVILHIGDYRYDYSHPSRLVNVLHTFPKLRVDAAHMGGWSIYDIGLDNLRDENCFVDISSTFSFTGLRHARELVEQYGVERVLFGSDFPMADPLHEYEMVMQMGLSDEDLEKIFHRNAERFLGFSVE